MHVTWWWYSSINFNIVFVTATGTLQILNHSALCMCRDLSELMKILMSVVVKSGVLKQAKDLMKLDLSTSGNLLDRA